MKRIIHQDKTTGAFYLKHDGKRYNTFFHHYTPFWERGFGPGTAVDASPVRDELGIFGMALFDPEQKDDATAIGHAERPHEPYEEELT